MAGNSRFKFAGVRRFVGQSLPFIVHGLLERHDLVLLMPVLVSDQALDAEEFVFVCAECLRLFHVLLAVDNGLVEALIALSWRELSRFQDLHKLALLPIRLYHIDILLLPLHCGAYSRFL